MRAYCAVCGQPAPSPHDYSLRLLLRGVFDELSSYDGRIWQTLRLLLFKPGLLAREHFDGRRARYLTPFRVFVIANVAAWLVIPFLGIQGFTLELGYERALFAALWRHAMDMRASLEGIALDKLVQRIEGIGAAEDSVAVLCMCPLFALGLKGALATKGYRYVQHLVFAAHFYVIHLLALMLSWATVIAPIARWLVGKGLLSGGSTILWFLHLAVAPVLFPYLYPAVRRAYVLTRSEAVWRAALVSVWACLVSRAFLDIAFALAVLFA